MPPVVSTVPLKLSNHSVDANGFYRLNQGDSAILRFAVASSGHATPLVQVIVDWGDGTKDGTDFRSVGQQFQYQHAYGTLGSYTISVTARNLDGEVSVVTSSVTLPVRVVVARTAVAEQKARWSGLALPGRSIRESFEAVQEELTPLVCGLAVAGVKGERSIRVDSLEDQFTKGLQIILSEPSKLYTSARILERTTNLITLDAQLLDDYTPSSAGQNKAARVELRRASLRRSSREAPRGDPWHFPISRDHDLVRASVRMALITRPGERLMNPEYGTVIVPFEPLDGLTIDQTRGNIQRAINRWEPRAQVSHVVLNPMPNDNEIRGRCICQMIGDGSTFELDFTINPERAT